MFRVLIFSFCVQFVCVCILCYLYATGGAVRVLEFVLSSAACFCFLRITSWSFCFTRELATAPVNQQHNQPIKYIERLTNCFITKGGARKGPAKSSVHNWPLWLICEGYNQWLTLKYNNIWNCGQSQQIHVCHTCMHGWEYGCICVWCRVRSLIRLRVCSLLCLCVHVCVCQMCAHRGDRRCLKWSSQYWPSDFMCPDPKLYLTPLL